MTVAGPKDHRYVRPRKKRERCQARGHDQAWAALSGADNIVCFDCRCCFNCTAETCPARTRPGFQAGAVGEPTVSGAAADQPREPERAPAASVETVG